MDACCSDRDVAWESCLRDIFRRKAKTELARISHHYLQTTFVVALAVRLINLMLLGGHDAYFSEPDLAGFWALGSGLADPRTFSASLMSMTYRMPLYPLLLGGVQSLFGDSPWVAVLLQAIIDAGTCALVAALGALISQEVGLLAGLLAAFSTNLIILSTADSERYRMPIFLYGLPLCRRGTFASLALGSP